MPVLLAGAGELFGKVEEEVPQLEKAPFHTRSSYSISKVGGFDLTENREAYNSQEAQVTFEGLVPRRAGGPATSSSRQSLELSG
jgi:GDP-D-mannose dehydratase